MIFLAPNESKLQVYQKRLRSGNQSIMAFTNEIEGEAKKLINKILNYKMMN